jgi:hypothetical protein
MLPRIGQFCAARVGEQTVFFVVKDQQGRRRKLTGNPDSINLVDTSLNLSKIASKCWCA